MNTDLNEPQVAALTEAVVECARQRLTTPQLLTQDQAFKYVGLSRSAWFRLKSMGELPAPVNVEGSDVRYRRTDLDRWIARLKSKR